MTPPGEWPSLSMPFPDARCAAEDLVRARVRTVRERMDAAGLGRFVQDDDVMVDLVCRTSPQADAGTVGPVADWLLWIFPLDDLLEVASAGGFAALPPLVMAGMVETCEDAAARMSPGWGARFRRDFDSYVFHASRQAAAPGGVALPALADFVALRREEGAAKPTVDLVEIAARADLPEDFRESPPWRGLCDACADVLTWTNDIYSYRRERHAGNRFNLVDVLCEHDGLPEADALSRAVAMTGDKVREFLGRADALTAGQDFTALPEAGRAGVLRCVRGMEHWMRGQYAWFTIRRPSRYDASPAGRGVAP